MDGEKQTMKILAILALMFTSPAWASGDHGHHDNNTTVYNKKENNAAAVIGGAILTCLIVSAVRGEWCWKHKEEPKKDPEPLKVTPDNTSDVKVIVQ